MRTQTKGRIEIPSQDEARAIVERARQLRAQTLARMLRAGWARIAPSPADAPAGAMPHARA